MKESLQDLLLYIPLHHLTFLVPLQKEPLFFDTSIEYIPDGWLERPTLLIFHNDNELKKLDKNERMIQLIQDPNLIGLVLIFQNKVSIKEEVLTLFQECQIPIVQVDDPSSLLIFQHGGNPLLSYSHFSKELKGFMDKGFITVASELAKGLETPFLYVDENNQLLWQTGQESDLKKANQWLRAHFKKIKKDSNPKTNFLISPKTDPTNSFELYPINIAEEIKQILVVSSKLVDWQKRLIDKLVGLTVLLLQTGEMFIEQQQTFKEHFVYDLLYHKFESKKVMVKQGKTWGWNLEKPHHLVLVNIELSEELKMNIDWMDEITLFLEEQKSKMGETMIVFPFQDQIVMLIVDGEDRTNSERKKNILKIANQLAKDLSSQYSCYRFYIGIGKWYQDTLSLNKSYQEAKLALQFGQIWFEYRSVCHINDLGILRILICIHQEILRDFSQEYLSHLIESDRGNGTDYINTLKAFIKHQGIINEIADVLFIHPNTLRNRMKKIEDITGVNLQDPEQFMNLAIAVKILFFMDFAF